MNKTFTKRSKQNIGELSAKIVWYEATEQTKIKRPKNKLRHDAEYKLATETELRQIESNEKKKLSSPGCKKKFHVSLSFPILFWEKREKFYHLCRAAVKKAGSFSIDLCFKKKETTPPIKRNDDFNIHGTQNLCFVFSKLQLDVDVSKLARLLLQNFFFVYSFKCKHLESIMRKALRCYHIAFSANKPQITIWLHRLHLRR